MQKQHRPLHPAPHTQLRLLSAALLLCIAQGSATAATPPPIVDTEPPTNITVSPPDPAPAPSTFYAIRPVITLDMATQNAFSVIATDATSATSPSTDFPGYPTGQIGPLGPGRHTITWTATDLGNNPFSSPQYINVLPEVNFAVDQKVGEGNNNVTVTAHLSGPAPIYPVILDYTISGGTATAGDHNATNGQIIINAGTSSNFTFAALNDATPGEPDETLVFTLTTATLPNGRVIAGSKTSHTVTITEANLAPIIAITATQNGGPQTHAVTTDGGLVTLTADVRDPNGDAISGYDWSASDNALAAAGGTSSSTFNFNPTGLSPGTYTARLTVRDNSGATDGSATSTRDLLLRVHTTAPALSTTDDSDDDGITDSVEGLKDGDGDGIPDYLDAVSNPAWLQGWDLLTYKADLKRSDTFVSGPITFSWSLDTVASNRVYYPLLLTTQAGLKLSIGPTAFANGSNHGRIDTAAATLYFGSTLATNLVSADGQVVDIEISGLGTTGQSVYLVIPQAAPLPSASNFKIIGSGHTWQDFNNEGSGTGKKNTLLYATSKSSDNYCPNPATSDVNGITGYAAVAANSSALNSGISCVELLIEDGGPNDYDGKANGVIHLLGAPFINADSSSGTITPVEGSGPATGTAESLNKISLTQGGGGIGFIGLWGVVGLLLAHWGRRH